MRKILLGTTAVVGAALIGTGVAQAQTAPTVRVGGFFEFTAGYVQDDADRALTGVGVTIPAVGTPATPGFRPARNVARSRTDFRSDLEVQVIVRGKAANGLSYGAEVEMQIDNVTNSAPNANTGSGGIFDTDEAWMFISSPTLGTLQLGDQDNAGDQLKVSAPGVTNLGESGGWDEFIIQSGDGTRYLLSTINDGNDSTRVIYLSPQFFGFDFGVSYAPNGSEGENFSRPNAASGITGPFQRDPNATIRNEISGAIRYRGSFGNVGVAAAFSAQRADAQENNGVVFGGAVVGLENPYAFQAGATVTAFGLSVGGHYVWGKYGGDSFGRSAIREGLDDSTNWTIGATYTIAGVQLGAFYGSATRDNGGALAERRQRAFGVGATYSLAPGLEVFGNYTSISNDNIANSSTNPTAYAIQRNRDLDVFILGTRLAF